MDDLDLRMRNATYEGFVRLGRAPTPAEVAAGTGEDEPAVRASWRRLHEVHALVLERGRDELRMANPFSAVPTAYRVETAGRQWFANCAWDAFGVCAALSTDGRVHGACSDCGEPYVVEVRGQRPDRDDLVFHCLVPASSWWEDIGFT